MEIKKHTTFFTCIEGESFFEMVKKQGVDFNPRGVVFNLHQTGKHNGVPSYRLTIKWTEEESWEV